MPVWLYEEQGGDKAKALFEGCDSDTSGVPSLIRAPLHMNDPLPIHHECTMKWRAHTHTHTSCARTHTHIELTDRMVKL